MQVGEFVTFEKHVYPKKKVMTRKKENYYYYYYSATQHDVDAGVD